MNQAGTSAGDFRDAAVAASEAVLLQTATETGGVPADPGEAGVSYCLRAEGDGVSALQRLNWTGIIALVVGFGGLLGAGPCPFPLVVPSHG